MLDLDLEDNNLLHAAVTNTSHNQEVLDLLLRMYSLEKTTRDGKHERDTQYLYNCVDNKRALCSANIILEVITYHDQTTKLDIH